MMVHPDSSRIPRVPPYSGTYSPPSPISFTGLSPSMAKLSNLVQLSAQVSFMYALQPHTTSRMVWAIPISLTATQGISIDFSSSGYLDVSVPLVNPPEGVTTEVVGFPHSEIPGSKLD